ncbi:hypothetical protein CISG_10131 [Coccidioides immitis RMSCC 3703]|uniref:50S ribosomal protein L16 n=1 Tax=Coccidioides immitis RMSCC 3703 TaxID=454286 RepID=A0A0J8TIQ5_COCIT|nr:hypothetical protein CISG_10131 [Coccidioides immitis RMSCC 3703]
MGPSSAIFSGLQLSFLRPFLSQPHSLPSSARCFSTSKPASDWLVPKMSEKSKSRKGRPRMATGGSTRGTTVVWGDYGLRMRDHDRRISAAQLKIGMGKGTGQPHYLELKGNLHEKVAREAFRLAAHKLPGLYEFVKKGEPAVVGITKLSNGVTLESLKRARREITSPVVSEQPSPPTQNAAP